jgi:rhomboid protease GluP
MANGSMLCPGCRKLISLDEERCPFCGMRRPGLFGLAPKLQQMFGARLDMVWGISFACIALYAISLAIDIRGIGMQGLFGMLSPSHASTVLLGSSGARPVQWGSWLSVFTAIYLHGSLLHIFFNVWWIRQLGQLADAELGPARFFILFSVSGACGFVASTLMGTPFTLGASGSVLGLLGAMIAFRRRRGAGGDMLTQQFLRYAVFLFILSFMPGVDKWAHFGGFLVGYLLGRHFSGIHERPETRREQFLALALFGVTVLGFILAVVKVLPAFLDALKMRGL